MRGYLALDGEDDPKEKWPFKEINGHCFRYNRYNPETLEPKFESGESCCWCGWKIEFADKPCREEPKSKAERKKKEPAPKPEQMNMDALFNL